MAHTHITCTCPGTHTNKFTHVHIIPCMLTRANTHVHTDKNTCVSSSWLAWSPSTESISRINLASHCASTSTTVESVITTASCSTVMGSNLRVYAHVCVNMYVASWGCMYVNMSLLCVYHRLRHSCIISLSCFCDRVVYVGL